MDKETCPFATENDPRQVDDDQPCPVCGVRGDAHLEEIRKRCIHPPPKICAHTD